MQQRIQNSKISDHLGNSDCHGWDNCSKLHVITPFRTVFWHVKTNPDKKPLTKLCFVQAGWFSQNWCDIFQLWSILPLSVLEAFRTKTWVKKSMFLNVRKSWVCSVLGRQKRRTPLRFLRYLLYAVLKRN